MTSSSGPDGENRTQMQQLTSSIVTNGFKVYTRAATIAGSVSNLADVVVVPGTPPCIADLYRDGIVNGADLGILLAGWGACP